MVLQHKSIHPTNSNPGWWQINNEIFGINGYDYEGEVVDISDNGSVILFIGLLDSELSPVKTDLNFWDDNKPVKSLALVPELPR